MLVLMVLVSPPPADTNDDSLTGAAAGGGTKQRRCFASSIIHIHALGCPGQDAEDQLAGRPVVLVAARGQCRVDLQRGVAVQLAGDEHARDLGGDRLLQEPADGPGAVLGDVGLGQDVVQRVLRHGDLDVAVSQAVGNGLHLQVHDGAELRTGQGLEDDDVVQSIEELGPEVLADDAQHFLTDGFGDDLDLLRLVAPIHAGVDAATVHSCLLQVFRPKVAREDDDGVFEVDGAPLTVGQAACHIYMNDMFAYVYMSSMSVQEPGKNKERQRGELKICKTHRHPTLAGGH